MFSWRPIHEETARKLLEFEHRQEELIALLAQMGERGLNVVPITDHPTDDSDGTIKAIDPFTFVASFNRPLTQQNRRRNWEFLKETWQLKSPVPGDFNAIPTITPQGAWFFPWEYLRDPQDIPRLWRLARVVLEAGWAKCDAALFDECLAIRNVGVAKLTTGLFWIAPGQVLPLPSTTVQYLKANGIDVDVSDKPSYDAVMAQVRSRLSGDFIMESHKAWLHCQSEQDLSFEFSEAATKGIWRSFSEAYPDFVDFGNPGEGFRSTEIAYKRAGWKKFDQLGGREEVARRLAAHDAPGALDIITKSVALNIASFQSWRPSMGADRPEILADVLAAFLEATEQPYSGNGTLLPIFDALARHDLDPAWDTLSVVLWALRPADYFPIKISYYRALAEKLGHPLPSGRPDAMKLHQVIRFGQAFWKIAEPKHPADWIDVQSFLWVVQERYQVESLESSTKPAKSIWLIAPGERARLWEEFHREGVIGIGWDSLGNLADYGSKREIEAALKAERKSEVRPTNDAHACWEFAHVLAEGDIVVAKSGLTKVVGIGRVKSGYIHAPERSEYQHMRKVDWLRTGDWTIDGMLAVKTLTNITPYPDFARRLLQVTGAEALAIELFGEAAPSATVAESIVEEPPAPAPPIRFDEAEALGKLYMSERDFRHIHQQLRRKKNVILQGPPGVGKTFVAQTLAYSLLGEKDPSRVQMVQFHQSYGYEEFIQGLRPTANGSYVLRDGVFYSFCEKAREDRRDFVFIIDEINRGNLSKILGELMMLIEHDKRSERYAMSLAYSDPGITRFFVPPNVHILGLMNTADRSLAMVDYALRRRFAFVSLKPEFQSPKFKADLISKGMDETLADRLIAALSALNDTIRKDRSDLGEGFCIGHSYFCPDGSTPDRAWIDAVLDFEIRPLLMEYWMEGPEKAEKAITDLKAGLS